MRALCDRHPARRRVWLPKQPLLQKKLDLVGFDDATLDPMTWTLAVNLIPGLSARIQQRDPGIDCRGTPVLQDKTRKPIGRGIQTLLVRN